MTFNSFIMNALRRKEKKKKKKKKKKEKKKSDNGLTGERERGGANLQGHMGEVQAAANIKRSRVSRHN
jgi:hypothetical protein